MNASEMKAMGRLVDLLTGKALESRRADVEKWAASLVSAGELALTLDGPRYRKSGAKHTQESLARLEKLTRNLLLELEALRLEAFWGLVEELAGEELHVSGLVETEADRLLARLADDLPALLSAIPGARKRLAESPTKADGPVKRGAAYVADRAHTAFSFITRSQPTRGPDSGKDDGQERSEFINFLKLVYEILGFKGVSATSQARKAIDRHIETREEAIRHLRAMARAAKSA